MNPKTTSAQNPPALRLRCSPVQLLLVLTLLGWCSNSHAQGFQTDTWTGGGANDDWATAANWTTAVTTNGDDLIFTGSVQLTPVNNFSGLNLDSITFNAPGFALSGNAVTITNGITDNTGANSSSVPLVLGASQTFQNTAGGTTNTESGTIGLGTNNLNIGGSGDVFLTGVLSSTNGGTLTVNSGGIVRLGGANGFGTNTLEAVTISGGTLQMNVATAIPSGPGVGNVMVNATLDMNGYGPTLNGLDGGGIIDNLNAALTGTYLLTIGTVNSNGVFSGSIKNTSGSVALTKNGFGTEQLNGNNFYSGQTTVNAGTLIVGPDGSLGLNSKNMVITPGAVLDVTQLGVNGYYPQLTFNLNAGTPTKPYTNYYGSYDPAYPDYIITTNITSTTTNITTNSIVNVINADVNGNFSLYGGSFTPVAPAPGYATFTVNGNLTLDNSLGLGANSLYFLLNNVTNAGGGLNDLIQVTNGTLNIGDNVNIVISPANGTLATGKYTLIESTNYVSGGDVNQSGPANFTVIAPRGVSGTIDTTSQPGNILLTASGTATPGTITWAGTSAVNNNNWDIHVTQNWNNHGTPDYFYSGDNVTFNDAGVGTINFPGPVTPASVTFNNNLTNYVFNASGAGFITGDAGLTLNGAGSVTFNNPNSFTGNTVLNNGTLILGSYGIFGGVLLYNGVAPGQLIFGGPATFEQNENIINVSQTTTFSSLTLNSGANAQMLSNGRGSQNLSYIAFNGVNRSLGSSLYVNYTIKPNTPDNGIYITNTVPLANGLLGGWAHVGNDWLQPQTSFLANTPASGVLNYAGYSNNAALAIWVATNNMSVSNSTFADTASATVNTLKLSGPATVTVSSGQTLTIATGGLLVSSAGTGASAINGGTLKGAPGADLIVLQNLTLTPLTIGSVIADNGSPTALTLGGLGGTVILTNNNTYTGPTYINAGSLQVGAGAASGSIASSSSILDNGFISFNRPDATSVGFLSGLGGVSQLGTGILTLTADNTFKGLVTISAGTLQLGTGGATGSISNAVGLVDNGKLVVNNSGTVNCPNVVSGSGALIQEGAGTLVIATNETYAGNTIISNGAVVLTASGSVSNTKAIVVEAGALLDASSAGGLTLRSAAPAEILAGSGTINGSVTTAAGTTLLPGTNGVIGTLTINNNLNLNGGSYLFDVGNSSSDKILVGGTLSQNSGVVIIQVSGTPLANGLYPLITAAGGVSGAAANIAVADFIQPGQIAVLTNSTPNELDLLVTSGVFPTVTWLGDGSQNLWDTTAASKWLDTNGNPALFNNGDFVIFNNSGSVSPDVNLDAVVYPSTVTVNATNNNYTFGISGGSGINRISGGASLTKNGPGTLTLQTVNDYLGGTVINGGVVQLNGDGGANDDGMVGIGNVVNNGTLIANNANSEMLAGNLTGNGLLAQQGVGPLVLSGNNSAYAGPITSSSILEVGNGFSGTLGTGNVTNNGSLLLNPGSAIGVTANIVGTGNITNLSGTVTLGGVDSYAGTTAISGGKLVIGSVTAIPPTTTISMNTGTGSAGTLDLNGYSPMVASLGGTNIGFATSTFTPGQVTNSSATLSTITVTGITTNTFYSQIQGNVALALLNGPNITLEAGVTAASGTALLNTFTGGIIVSNAALTLGADLGSGNNIGNEGTAAAGVGPITLEGTNGVMFAHEATGSVNDTGASSIGVVNVPAGQTGTIYGPQRATLTCTLQGGGNLNYYVGYVRSRFAGNLSAFTGQITFGSWVSGNAGGNLGIDGTAGLPNAVVVFQTNNPSGDQFQLSGTSSGNVYPMGSLSGGDNTSILGGGTSAGGDGTAPTIWSVGGLNTSTAFGGIISDAGCGIRKVGTGTWTLTNSTLSYGGQTVVSNGTLAFAPLVPNLTALANTNNYLVSSNFTLVSPGILDLTGIGGTLYLGHSTVQSISGNGTLNGSLRVTNGVVAPGLRAGLAGYFTGSTLIVNGSATMLAASTNIFSLNRTNTTAVDSLTASSIVFGGALIVTNVGDTAFPNNSTNTFQLYNGPVSGSFITLTLPALPANEYWFTNNLNVNGTIALVNTTILATNPTNILFSISGNTLALSWPADHLGWTLQSQTNSLTTGLGANWVDVAGSSSVTGMSITVDPTKPTVFYRLSQLP